MTEITHYRFEKGHCNQLKSKVQIAVSDFLSKHHGKLIEASELPALKESIKKEVEAINAKLPRCKPLNISYDSWGATKDIYVRGCLDWSYILRACTLSHPSAFVNTTPV